MNFHTMGKFNGKRGEKWDEDLVQLQQLINKSLDMKRWGFQLSYQCEGPRNRANVIYNSIFCRVSFRADWVDQFEKSISIFYGRLHAPDDGGHMIWNGEECRSWHHILYALPFLDGLTPRKAIERKREKNNIMDQLDVFNQSVILKNKLSIDDNREYIIKMHAHLWKYYGQRLFDLFDIRQPQLWDKYRQFLTEYKELLGYKQITGNNRPGIDKVC